MSVIRVDLTDAMTRLSKAFSYLSEDVKTKAFVWSINKLGDKLLTGVRRDVVEETGAKYGRVMKAIVKDRAHMNRLTYYINATDKAMKLSEFSGSLRAGKKNPSAAPWNKRRTFKNAFVIPMKGSLEIVKRVQKRTGAWPMNGKKPNGSGKVKVLYGPIIPKEMIRPGNPSTKRISEAIPLQFPAMFERELAQAIGRAKAASGT